MNERKVFQEFLAENNLRMTYQREVILDVFLKTKTHVSPEDLYNLVKKRDASIGQATVYRTLKLLSEAGLASEVEFGDGVMRYEHKYGQGHHDHLVCEVCGKKVEVFDPLIEELQEKLAKRHGFVLTNHKMYLYGICNKCKKIHQKSKQ
jgi:Fur family ferric uptake transcriptional regulator